MIDFTCRYCGITLSCEPELAGTLVRCPDCAGRVEVPEPVLDAELVEEEDLPEAVPARPTKKRSLVVHGTNGSLELRGAYVIVRHDGGFSLFDRVPAGSRKVHVLAIAKVHFYLPGRWPKGYLQLGLGDHPDLKMKDYCDEPLVDAYTVTFDFYQ